MANIVLDFLHNYQTGERRETEPANAYQYDEGHVLEAVLPEVITACEIHYWIRGMEEADAYTPTSITPNENNSCTVLGNIPNSYFETNGELRIYIVVTDGTASITTYEGKLHIAQRAMPDDYVDDDPDNDAVQIIAAARGYAETSEAWAVGQINGEDVPSTADQYQNNASYYANQAASAASSAAAQASLAPAYDNTATYAVGDYCLHDGQLYECTTAITTAEAWTAAHWTAVTVGEKVADLETTTNDLKEDLNDKVDLTGENQVTPQNIEGMQFTKTTTEVEGDNIFDPSTMVYAEGKYVYVDNNEQINHVTDSYFNAYVIPVEQNAKYVFPQARFAALGKGNERYSEAVGATINYATQANTGEATYLFLSYPSTTSASSITVKKVTEVNTYSDFILPGWMQQTDKVDKDGIGQVTTKNIEGMTLDGTRVSANLFPTATLVVKDKCVGGINSVTGKVSLYTNTGMDTYIIPVDGKSTYTFTYARTACVVVDLDYTPVGDILSNVRQIDSLGGGYILFSFTPASYPVSTYMITKPVTYYEIPSNWIIPQEGGNKTLTDKSSGAIASDGTMTIVGRSALKDGQMIAFKGKFASFSGFTLNFFGTAVTNYIAVTGTTIAIKNTTTTPTPVNHNLTIENEVSLTVEFVEGNAKISLYSMGNVYTQTVSWNQTGGTVTQPQIKSDGTAFSEANLVTSYDCAIRDIWYFGDSYTGSSSPNRWCYYLKENGYMGNLLINGSAGATSGGAIISFNALLKYGTPKIAVFATGMNDGSDSSAPPDNYVNRRTEFLSLCESNGIEPVFCTIPTVPSVNNEQKNAWIRSSGYRYIDFASAVGADGTGAWYSGMLSGDNVHPSETGAKALYTQALIDLPELTISN